MPKGEELKNYINTVRAKAATYKDKKRELSDVSAELGVLQRTHEVCLLVIVMRGRMLLMRFLY